MTYSDYLALIEEIKAHDIAYYGHANPLISDYEYDQKMRSLLDYEKKHPDQVAEDSPSKKLLEPQASGFERKEHLSPMISLSNTYSFQELKEFVERVERLLGEKKISFFSELKMDGVAISIRYEKKKLFHALTRGDGRLGDDVTLNVKTIQDLPLEVQDPSFPDSIEIRGEIYMLLSTFREINLEREEEGLEPFANPRNAAAGSLKLLNPKEVAKRKLKLLCYGVGEAVMPAKTQEEVCELLKKWGFPTARLEHRAFCQKVEEIEAFANRIEKERSLLPFEIDGIVVKVNDLSAHRILGSTGKVPRFATAYKFEPLQAQTKIVAITVQVGRTGVLTPVAELEPVLLAGSKISRATLHNQEEILRKDIRIGDVVTIEKGGDVIPKVVQVDFTKRPSDSVVWHMPTHCPICKEKVVIHEKEVAVRCPSPTCLGKKERQIEHFASKQALDIENLGTKVIEQLIQKSLIARASDIYLLDREKLSLLEGFKEKSIHNLLSSIEKSKKCSLDRFIMGLGIPSVGKETALIIAQKAKSLDHFLQMKSQDFLLLEGIGEKTAHQIEEFLQDQDHLEEIFLLLKHGVLPQPVETKEGIFSGLSFVLTGTLENYTREKAAEEVMKRGGKILSSVTKKTSYVIVGKDPGSKLGQAEKLSIPILDEKAFLELLNR